MIGLAQGALDHTHRLYARASSSGKRSASFQAVQHQIARAATDNRSGPVSSSTNAARLRDARAARFSRRRDVQRSSRLKSPSVPRRLAVNLFGTAMDS
jgi:alkylation response protein AidB-like acyl-CoA dehydrogenase